MKYESGAAFRRALEDRLKSINLKDNVPLVRLRKMVDFDRFLARLTALYPDSWLLKGGFALQLRMGNRARTTKDIDLLVFAEALKLYPFYERQANWRSQRLAGQILSSRPRSRVGVASRWIGFRLLFYPFPFPMSGVCNREQITPDYQAKEVPTIESAG